LDKAEQGIEQGNAGQRPTENGHVLAGLQCFSDKTDRRRGKQQQGEKVAELAQQTPGQPPGVANFNTVPANLTHTLCSFIAVETLRTAAEHTEDLPRWKILYLY
jgi:hypothetical protein